MRGSGGGKCDAAFGPFAGYGEKLGPCSVVEIGAPVAVRVLRYHEIRFSFSHFGVNSCHCQSFCTIRFHKVQNDLVHIGFWRWLPGRLYGYVAGQFRQDHKPRAGFLKPCGRAPPHGLGGVFACKARLKLGGAGCTVARDSKEVPCDRRRSTQAPCHCLRDQC